MASCAPEQSCHPQLLPSYLPGCFIESGEGGRSRAKGASILPVCLFFRGVSACCSRVSPRPGRKCTNSPAAPRHWDLTGEGAPLTRILWGPAV